MIKTFGINMRRILYPLTLLCLIYGIAYGAAKWRQLVSKHDKDLRVMEIPAANSDAWNNAEGTRNAKPIMIRYRPRLADHVGDSKYPRRLTIQWVYKEQNSSGLPSADQSNQMQTFEDALVECLDHDRCAILAAITTSSGSRAWEFYGRDNVDFGRRINVALAGFPKLPIEMRIEQDPDWSRYQLLLRQCH